MAMYSNDFSDGWRIINKQDYEDYQSFLNNGDAYDLLVDWSKGDYTKSEIKELFNNKAKAADDEASSQTSDLVNAEVSDASLNSGTFTYDIQDLLSYPTFTVYVDAGENGYIEVTKPTGEPDIVSTSGAEIKEGDEGEVSATVRNVGNGEGQFSARLSSCGEGFSIVDEQDTKNVAAGDTVTYSFDVAFSSVSSDSKEVSSSCAVEVSGVESSDATSVSVTGVQQSECNPGDEKRQQRNDGRWEIYVCQSNGLKYSLDVTCAEGEKAVAQGNNDYSCEKQSQEKEQPSGGDGSGSDSSGLFSDLFGSSGSDNLLGQVHTALSVLAGLVVGFLGYKGSRWVDGEYQVKGGFKLFASRSLSRVKRGRLQVGVIGGIVAFAAGTLVALQIPLLVQLIVIVGAGAIAYYFR